MSYPDIALASSSPRRRELLAQLGVNFTLVKADIDESVLAAEDAKTYVQRLALAKAEAGLARLPEPKPVLGADTIVVIDNQILGKPSDFADFKRTMQLLSGRCHQVMTAIALVSPQHKLQQLVCTDVYFRALTDSEIEQYWQSGEPHDKAGGYGIQGLGGRFVKRINGSYTAVVGLPLCETEQLLQQWQELA
ncbi:MAG TPA: nucleoside triphosphate pyrophosphatase [Rheinheimera sp.]|nr:nucleoside triphosphate pyrophosphatase [Rheinheimera sp.]